MGCCWRKRRDRVGGGLDMWLRHSIEKRPLCVPQEPLHLRVAPRRHGLDQEILRGEVHVANIAVCRLKVGKHCLPMISRNLLWEVQVWAVERKLGEVHLVANGHEVPEGSMRDASFRKARILHRQAAWQSPRSMQVDVKKQGSRVGTLQPCAAGFILSRRRTHHQQLKK